MQNDAEPSFPLASMSGKIRLLTWLLLLMPAALAPLLIFADSAQPWWIVGGILAGVLLVYVAIWLLGRPTRFEVTAQTVRIRWPLRQKQIPLDNIESIETIDSQQVGAAIRTFGAGGLWGGFGLFWSRKLGHFAMYASRQDGWVRIALREGKDLLITPEKPERFVAEAQRNLQRPASQTS